MVIDTSGPLSIFNRAGTSISIAGDILFGTGDDILLGGSFNTATGRFTNISGTDDGGAGLDTLAFSIGSDATLGSTMLPAIFERIQLTLKDHAAVTFDAGLDLDHGMQVGGEGSRIITHQ